MSRGAASAAGRKPVRLLVSACLLGERVRYDGGHRRDPFVAGSLASLAELVPVCPETEVGLPVPREAMELFGDPAAPRLEGVSSGTDHTAAMREWTERRLDGLAAAGLRGYVCKSGSPSCASAGAAVRSGAPPREEGEGETAAGLFTGAFRRRFPDLPVADEVELADPVRRDAFLARVAALSRTP